MAGRKPRKQPDLSSATIDSNCAIGHYKNFMEGRKKDWNTVKNLPGMHAASGGDYKKTFNNFMSDFGGGDFGRGAAKLGGYAVGGAMLFDMLFD